MQQVAFRLGYISRVFEALSIQINEDISKKKLILPLIKMRFFRGSCKTDYSCRSYIHMYLLNEN